MVRVSPIAESDGVVELARHWWWDTVVALVIGIFAAVRATVLGRQVLAVLEEDIRDGMVVDQVMDYLTAQQRGSRCP